MEIEITSGGEMLQHGVPVASVSFRRPYFDRQIAGTYYGDEYDTDAAKLAAMECQLEETQEALSAAETENRRLQKVIIEQAKQLADYGDIS